jgi:hypothetical protein
LSALILIKLVEPGFESVNNAEPTVVAPKSDLNSAAVLVDTVLAELILINVVALGSVSLNKLAPTVVAPKFVIADVADVAPVPPLIIATVPVTFVAFPSRLAVIVPALKLPDVSLDTIVLTVFALVALLVTVNVALEEVLAEKLAEPDKPTPETPNVKVASLISPVVARVPVVGRVNVVVPVDVNVTKCPPEKESSDPDVPMLSRVLLLLSKPFFATNLEVVAIIDSLSSINYFYDLIAVAAAL